MFHQLLEASSPAIAAQIDVLLTTDKTASYVAVAAYCLAHPECISIRDIPQNYIDGAFPSKTVATLGIQFPNQEDLTRSWVALQEQPVQ